ncbi:MAG: hypothetical protein FJ130_01895 [Deltaproteobacteria bacterium]|nr:hypothetical protein [Deltaproteobacteria bacterium]
MQYKKILVLILLAFTVVSGCALCPPVDPKQKLIMHFDDYMIPLARAVDVVADKLPPDAKDQEIFLAAVNRSGNPNMLKPFDGYVLKARIEDGVGVILLCSPDGKEGIIEDVTCTTRPDTHRPTGSPCAYLLNVKRVCSAP